MVEIDETFTSLAQWEAFAAANPSVYIPADCDKIGERILARGFVEPVTGRYVQSIDLDKSNRNWREGLFSHGLNSRGRAVLKLIHESLGHTLKADALIYATEGVTALVRVLGSLYPRLLTSEYITDPAVARRVLPALHQDLMGLTLPDDSFDVVTTNEVLEHLPDLDQGLREIARVLKPGGWHIGTHPFRFVNADSDLRARIEDGKIVHLKPPEIHGSPTDLEGCLVFETPGWDIIERCRAAGFSNPTMRFLASETWGYVSENVGVFVLCAQK